MIGTVVAWQNPKFVPFDEVIQANRTCVSFLSFKNQPFIFLKSRRYSAKNQPFWNFLVGICLSFPFDRRLLISFLLSRKHFISCRNKTKTSKKTTWLRLNADCITYNRHQHNQNTDGQNNDKGQKELGQIKTGFRLQNKWIAAILRWHIELSSQSNVKFDMYKWKGKLTLWYNCTFAQDKLRILDRLTQPKIGQKRENAGRPPFPSPGRTYCSR